MQTEFLEQPEGKLAYDDWGGAGVPVLMLPGLGALRSEYRYLAPHIGAAGYRAVSVDLRGQGESSAGWPSYDIPSVGRDIRALIDHLDGGPAHIIGTSYAPGAIVWAAAEWPKAIRSMTLIGAFVRVAETGLLQRLLFPVMISGPWKVSAWLMWYRNLYPTRKPDDFQAYLNELRASLREPGRFAALRGLATASKRPSEERLGQTKAPALVIMGTKDPDFSDPEGEARYIAERVRGRVVMVEGAGHYPQTEMPDQVVPVICDFLRSVDGV